MANNYSPKNPRLADAAGDHVNFCAPVARSTGRTLSQLFRFRVDCSMGRPIFWFTVTPLEGAEEGTDRWAVEHNWVSITPLRLDLTDEKDLARALSLAQTPPVSPAKKG